MEAYGRAGAWRGMAYANRKYWRNSLGVEKRGTEFIVIESGRQEVVITVEALPGDFARFSARTLGVLKSLRITQAP
jgi:hypothetical protein